MLLYYKCSNCRVLTQLIYVISKVINNDNDLAKKTARTFPQMSQGKSPPSWWTRPWRLRVEESENDM